jgi:hypothetical protein
MARRQTAAARTTRNDHCATVVDQARRHEEWFRISSALTTTHRRMFQQQATMVTPEAVIKALNEADVGFVLMGTYGVAGWRSEPRATQDVDVLVRKKDHRQAVRAIRALYPHLTVQDLPVVTRFTDPATGLAVVDLMKPSQIVFSMAFRNSIVVGGSHRIPNLEMGLVSKFAAMTSPNRSQGKKLIDGGDFYDMVITNQNALDRAKLRRLADKVYPDGGKEILQMVEDILAGRTLTF